MIKPKSNIPKKVYFKIVEIGRPQGRKGWRWKTLEDKSGCYWGVFRTYKQAKVAIREFRIRHKDILKERGTFDIDEVFKNRKE